MKKLFVIVAGMLLSLGLTAQNHFNFNYGSGFTSTSTSISFNYSVVCTDLLTSVGSGGVMYGRVLLQSGVQSYYIGSFQHRFSWNGSSVTPYTPGIFTENPFSIAPPTLGPNTTGSTTITLPVNTTCIPVGTYTVRVELYTYLTPPPEFPHNAIPNFTVGSSSYTPTPLWHVHPGGMLLDALITEYIGDGNIGSFTVSSGGGSIAGSASVTPGTCTSHPVINTTTTGGTSPYTLYYSSPSTTTSITSSSASINIPNATQGTYNLQLVDANGCRWSAVRTTVKPTATINVTPVSQTICKQSCIAFSATSGSGGSGFSYNWKHSNPATAVHTVATAATFSHDVPHIASSPTTANTYQVTMSNAYCSGTNSTVLTVTQSCTSMGGACSISNNPGTSSRPSGQGDELPTGSLKLFPNPASGSVLNVDLSELEISNANTNIEVYDAMGRLVRKRPVMEGMLLMELDINDFSQGMYVIRLVTHGEVLVSKKFIRQQ